MFEMKLKDFKKMLLELLEDDEDVQEAVQILVNKSQKQEKKAIGITVLETDDSKAEAQGWNVIHSEWKRRYKELEETLKTKENEFSEKEDEFVVQIKSYQTEMEAKENEIEGLREEKRELAVQVKDCQENLKLKESQLAKLQAREKELGNQIGIYQKEVMQLESEMDSLKEKCSKEKANAERIADFYKNNYGGLDEIYHKYLNLGSEIHRQLQRVLNPTESAVASADLLLGFGVQEGNIVALWENIAANADIYTRSGKIEDLITIFTYFFERYKKITYKQMETTIPNVGDIYDERYHTRTGNSNATGRITRVILPGFAIGKNINKKALVCVE